ncbi:MAG: nicotinate phosphoribosyltransferase [Aquificae bacterium]|nr:nicotinate phosphoribosyltransferase [Aquificota bacterium]
MIYFISDTHFYHHNILRLNPEVRKPLFEERILNDLFEVLKEEDTLYHLGDFTWELWDQRGILELWKKLPSRKVLLMGNHDRRVPLSVLKEFFDEIHELYHLIEVDGKRLLLTHYPALDLRTQRFPELQSKVRELFFELNCDLLVHGHVHYTPGKPLCGCSSLGIPCYNVNVELNDFKPVPLTRVLKKVSPLKGLKTPLP